jgi:TldD protein
MKRRDFIVKGAFALGAVAASDLWLGKIVAGESTNLMKTSLLDTYFNVTQEQIKRVLAATLAKGAEFADVFFEYRISSSLSFEEDTVKSARRGIVQGVGIRAVKGDQIGFAFSEELTLEKMLAAANAAAVASGWNISIKNAKPPTSPKTRRGLPF